MKSKYLILGLIVLVTLEITTTQVHASVTTKLETSQSTYRTGETISAWIRIVNSNQSTQITVQALLRDVRGKLSVAPVQYKVSMGPSEAIRLELFNIRVDNRFYSGPHVIQVSIVEGSYVVAEREAIFLVEGALEDMTLKPLVSGTADFKELTDTFVVGEKIYIGYQSVPEKPSVKAMLTQPDKTVIQLNLPTAITVKLIGVYSLRIDANSSGYRPKSLLQYIAVLKDLPPETDVARLSSNVSVTLSKTELNEGGLLEVKGTLTPIHGGATITIRYLKDGKEEAKKTVATNDDGQFLDSINPGSGSWTVTVSWIGDYNHDESTSESKAFNVVKAKWQIPGYKESSIIMGFVIAILVAQLKKGQKSTSTGH